MEFPVIEGIPVLINESSSVFSFRDFLERRDTFFQTPPTKIKQAAGKFMPTLDHNITTKKNYIAFVGFLLNEHAHPEVLVLGGSIIGHGLEKILSHPSVHFTETDVSFGPRPTLLFHAHVIPFHTATFDGVFAQSVL